MNWLILGMGTLVGLGLLGWMLANANPKHIASAVRFGGGGLLALAGLFLILRGMMVFGGPMVLAGVMMFARGLGWQGFGGFPGQARGRKGASSVSTGWLDMSLDHDSGDMDGRVLQGRFEGRQLSDLTSAELLDLMTEASSDGDTVRLLEAFMDRNHPDWRETEDNTSGASRPASDGPMTIHEALTVLGLPDDASDDDVREAHRTMMKSHHPDQGGSDWYATKLNQARDTLLGR